MLFWQYFCLGIHNDVFKFLKFIVYSIRKTHGAFYGTRILPSVQSIRKTMDSFHNVLTVKDNAHPVGRHIVGIGKLACLH